MDMPTNYAEMVFEPGTKGWCTPSFEIISKDIVKGNAAHQGNEISGPGPSPTTYQGNS